MKPGISDLIRSKQFFFYLTDPIRDGYEEKSFLVRRVYVLDDLT